MPNVSRIESDEDLAALNHKLVRFDCIISDMYEEEFFVAVLKNNDRTFIYKYFTECSVSEDLAEM